MNKKINWRIVLIFFAILIGVFIFLLGNNETKTQTNYEKALEYLEKGNQWVIETNYNEHCRSDYRSSDRGCYYDHEAKERPSESILSYRDLKSFNLSSTQILEICKKLAHKGEAAYCLNYYNFTEECLALARSSSGQYCNKYDSNNLTTPPSCLEYKESKDYLEVVCSLNPGIDIHTWYDSYSEIECAENGCFPHMSYTDFI